MRTFSRLFGWLLALSLGLTQCGQRGDVAMPAAGGQAEAAATATTVVSSTTYEPREGDVIFQSLPHNPLIDAIEGCSDSPYSHCGIVKRNGDAWAVVQAIGPVCQTEVKSFLSQGRDGSYSVFRLKEAYQPKVSAFISAALGYEGRPYDIHYDLDDGAIYCSELIYKAFQTATGEEMGELQRLGDLRWQPHVQVIKQIEDGNVPLERKMITPRKLSEAKQLVKVFSNYP
jgi:hypothetical protein